MWLVCSSHDRGHWLFITKKMKQRHLWGVLGTKNFQNFLLHRLTWVDENWVIWVDTKLVDNFVHVLIQKTGRLDHFSLSFRIFALFRKFCLCLRQLGFSTFSVCLSVCLFVCLSVMNFDLNYHLNGNIEWAEILFGLNANPKLAILLLLDTSSQQCFSKKV